MSDFINIFDDRHEHPKGADGNPAKADTPGAGAIGCDNGSWLIGIVDDEASVHDVTRLALKNLVIYDRPLEFVSAYSAREGFELIKAHPDMAIVLLDVVMESDDAGFLLVDRIRNELKNNHLQIVLRTGQPGYSPEEEVMLRYEINSYKTKSELTRGRLFAVVAAGIRAYQHLAAIARSREGLRAVIKAAADLFQERSVHDFAGGVLEQINALFHIEADSLFCVSQRPSDAPLALPKSADEFFVVATSDKFQQLRGMGLDQIHGDMREVALVHATLAAQTHLFQEQTSCLYLSTPSGWRGVIVADNAQNLAHADHELLQMFCLNVALGLENAKFFTHLNRAAYVDELTGLNSRLGLTEQAQVLCAKGETGAGTLYLLDIDDFHQVTDSMGFDYGNALLGDVAALLRRTFGDKARCARLHSDVFAILLPGSTMPAKDLAVQLTSALATCKDKIRFSITLGASQYERLERCDMSELISQAEAALRYAKAHRRGAGEDYSHGYQRALLDNVSIISDLRNALENNELFLMLQPKVEVQSGNLIGYEALVRWQHPQKGLIPPGDFMPQVEKSGLYYEFDLYIARAYCDIRRQYPALTLPVSINISANSLQYGSFVTELAAVFEQAGIAFDEVELEVTESVLIQSDEAISHLKKLHQLGFVICLDDFGVGFSSLSYLLNLPVQIIKVDRAFVASLDQSPDAVAVLNCVLRLGDELGKRIIVEGVETEAQLDLLAALGVRYVQGYYYYRPLAIEAALSLCGC
ncbi:GGDEF domain-containing response regulator [Shewanella sp. JM162201]|uniref:GGDEF domain-containing response regulator n=1 Tax=Shewanella jiangmenensis TaxID=2837387 RepID=A0ABS5V7T2_9GAMM|nr:EAL domain-containing protein [Shewanella jiangmenensis]MBT1445871.1 GGDEF domain-containing response regulator [Shewanella jiangmenensis]